MTLWQKLDMPERIAAVQTTAASKNIEDRAVEKGLVGNSSPQSAVLNILQ